ncbi:MAG: radical SAM protein [Bacteroidales bacterium]|nr:radical SAM protein [Bacteroidales bacterium]
MESENRVTMMEYEECMLCPRNCRVNRNAGELGYCMSDAELQISSICIHRGEEPAISGNKGICNVFFPRCTMQCIFCQNHQISRNSSNIITKQYTLESAVEEIIKYLDQGIEAVGFVTPTHFSPHIKAVIRTLHDRNYFPVVVYNTNGYENVNVLQQLEGLVDVYLPDFKYLDRRLALEYSDAADYPDVVVKAVLEMYRQKGNKVILNERGQAVSGLIIRHLVLPGNITDSRDILKWIAANLTDSVFISLMAQYYPTIHVSDHPVLGRFLTVAEYLETVNQLEDLGFYNGWIQELESRQNYRPDFEMSHPFEDPK